MSAKYLGEVFDIHGGGMDLLFPHHECEIAQSNAANRKDPVKYWLHNNMITINGQKMGKSLGNFITLDQFFTGTHKVLTQAYSPMTIRFFILQAHYRSTLDFSNEALQAAEKAYKRMMQASEDLKHLKYPGFTEPASAANDEIKSIAADCYAHMNDDLNTAMVIADLFALAGIVNKIKSGQINLSSITEENFNLLKTTFSVFTETILGLRNEHESASGAIVNGLMDMLMSVRQTAKQNKDFATSDKIRKELEALGIQIKDSKDKTEWSYE
jgi:cysteinyl-tRNA synthetase